MAIKLKQTITDRELLKKGISECKAFIVPSLRKGKTKYFFGGGFYDEESSSIVLYMDYIRPNYSKTISTRDVVHVMYDGEHCDILFSSGTWISGLTADKINDVKYDYPTRRFMDERVMIDRGDVRIVDLLSVQPSVAEQNRLYHIHTPPTKLLNYPNPLTFAYIKDGNETRVGYWDIIKDKLVGGTERMEVSLLDKSG